MLTLVLALLGICGCAGRMNVDLLQARIRQQEALLAESQLQITKTKSDLKQSQLETERLKSELNQSNGSVDFKASAVTVQKVKINPLASGGLNKDQLPGDEVVVIQFTPIDLENQPVKTPGELELVVIDPERSATEREIGRWKFTSEDCLDHWTRGITGSGFQFSLPLAELPTHSDLIVYLQYTLADSRQLLASQKIKVRAAPAGVAALKNRQPGKRVEDLDDINDPPPPAGDPGAKDPADEDESWAQDDPNAKPKKPGQVILHSANWTDATIPALR